MCNQHNSHVAPTPGVERGVSSELSFLLYNHMLGWDALYSHLVGNGESKDQKPNGAEGRQGKNRGLKKKGSHRSGNSEDEKDKRR